jgi:hypothetical protein
VQKIGAGQKAWSFLFTTAFDDDFHNSSRKLVLHLLYVPSVKSVNGGKGSVVKDAQVAGDDLVLENGARRDVDPVAVVGDDDHRALFGGVVFLVVCD